MRNFSNLFMLALVLSALATPAFAQGAANPHGYSLDLAALSPFAMAIASGLCGLGQGKAVVGAAEAMARNPGAAAGIRFALILGLVLIESLALYTLVIILLK